MPVKKTLKLAKASTKALGKKLVFPKASLPTETKTAAQVPPISAGKIEIAPPEGMAQTLSKESVYFQEEPKQHLTHAAEHNGTFIFDEKEKLITTFTAGGVVLSFGLSIGSVVIAPAWPAGGGLLATLGVISCFGAFMARESI
ncbi:MAG: hypothetical protein V1909_06105 [Candidatus Micrarchaeota archaeon]